MSDDDWKGKVSFVINDRNPFQASNLDIESPTYVESKDRNDSLLKDVSLLKELSPIGDSDHFFVNTFVQSKQSSNMIAHPSHAKNLIEDSDVNSNTLQYSSEQCVDISNIGESPKFPYGKNRPGSNQTQVIQDKNHFPKPSDDDYQSNKESNLNVNLLNKPISNESIPNDSTPNDSIPNDNISKEMVANGPLSKENIANKNSANENISKAPIFIDKVIKLQVVDEVNPSKSTESLQGNDFMFSTSFNSLSFGNDPSDLENTFLGSSSSFPTNFNAPVYAVEAPSDGEENELEEEYLKYKENQRIHEELSQIDINYEDYMTPENETIFDFQNASGVFEEHNLTAVSAVDPNSSIVENIVTADTLQFTEKFDFPDDYLFELDLQLIKQKNESEIRRALDIVPMILKVNFSSAMMKALGESRALHIINLTQILLEIRHQEYIAEKEERIYISQKVEEYISRRTEPGGSSSMKSEEVKKKQNEDLFRKFDSKNQGYLTASQLKTSLRSVGVPLKNDQIQQLFAKIQLKVKNQIDIFEFQELMDLLDEDTEDPMAIQKEIEEKLQAQITKMEEQLRELGKEKFTFETESTLLKRKLEETTSLLDANNEKYLPMEEQYRVLERDILTLQQENELLKRENARLEEAYQEEVKSHSKTKESSTNIISKLEASITQFESGTGVKIDRLDHKYRISELEAEVKELKDQLQHLRQSSSLNVERHIEEVNAISYENEFMRRELDESKLSIEQLERELRNIQIEFSKQQEKANQLEEEVSQQLTEISKLNTKNTALELDLESAHQTIENNPFKLKLELTEKEYKQEMEKLNDAHSSTVLELKAEIQSLKQQIDKVRVTSVDQVPADMVESIILPYKQNIVSLEKTLSALEKVHSDLELELQNVRNISAQVTIQNALLEKENSDQKADLVKLEREIQKLKESQSESTHNSTLQSTPPSTSIPAEQVRKYKLKILKLESRIDELEELLENSADAQSTGKDDEINLIYEETKRLKVLHEEELAKLNEAREKHQINLIEKEKYFTELQAEIDSKISNIEGEHKIEINSLKETIKEQTERIQILESDINLKTEQYANDIKKLKELNTAEFTKLEADFILERNEFTQRIEELEDTIQKLEDDKEQAIRALKETIKIMERKLKDVQTAQISTNNQEKEATQQHIQALEKSLRLATENHKILSKKVEHDQNLAQYQIKELHQHYQNETHHLQHVIKELTSENIWLQDQGKMLSDQLASTAYPLQTIPTLIDLMDKIVEVEEINYNQRMRKELHKQKQRIKSSLLGEQLKEEQTISKHADQQAKLAMRYKLMVRELEKKVADLEAQNKESKLQLQNIVIELRKKNDVVENLTQQNTALSEKVLTDEKIQNEKIQIEDASKLSVSTIDTTDTDNDMLFHVLTPSDLIESKLSKPKRKRPSSSMHRETVVIRSAFRQGLSQTQPKPVPKVVPQQRMWVIPYCWIHSTVYTLLVRKRDERWSCFEELVRKKDLHVDPLYATARIVGRNTFGLLHDPTEILEENIDISITNLYNDFQEFQRKKRSPNTILRLEIQNTISKSTDMCVFVPIPYTRIEIFHDRMKNALSSKLVKETDIYQFAWVKLSMLTSVIKRSLEHIESEDVNFHKLLEWKDGEIISPKFARILARSLESIEVLYEVELHQERRSSLASTSGTPLKSNSRMVRSRPQSAMSLRGINTSSKQ